MQDPSNVPPAATASAEADWPHAATSLSLALRATPAERRASLRLWLRWWHETARIPLTIDDIGVAEAKLAWWLQAIADAQQHAPQHPLLQGLKAALGDEANPPLWAHMATQVQALLGYLHQNRWMNEASLARHVTATTGQAAQGAAWLLGARDAASLAAAQAWGEAIRRHHLLARLGQDARAGWVHVPIDVLQRFDVKAHQLVKPTPGQVPAGLPGLLAHLHAQADTATQAARVATRALPRSARQTLRPLAVLGAVQAAQGRAVAQSPEVVLFERVALTPLAKSWAAQQQVWRLLWSA